MAAWLLAVTNCLQFVVALVRWLPKRFLLSLLTLSMSLVSRVIL